ncbi:hypothetical protein CDIK_2294 [Cucumispora dikerogammari]|nr:hypothetical protein CDIK_2294 [Cucumispora dikerogammari]
MTNVFLTVFRNFNHTFNSVYCLEIHSNELKHQSLKVTDDSSIENEHSPKVESIYLPMLGAVAQTEPPSPYYTFTKQNPNSKNISHRYKHILKPCPNIRPIAFTNSNNVFHAPLCNQSTMCKHKRCVSLPEVELTPRSTEKEIYTEMLPNQSPLYLPDEHKYDIHNETRSFSSSFNENKRVLILDNNHRTTVNDYHDQPDRRNEHVYENVKFIPCSYTDIYTNPNVMTLGRNKRVSRVNYYSEVTNDISYFDSINQNTIQNNPCNVTETNTTPFESFCKIDVLNNQSDSVNRRCMSLISIFKSKKVYIIVLTIFGFMCIIGLCISKFFSLPEPFVTVLSNENHGSFSSFNQSTAGLQEQASFFNISKKNEQ